MTTWSSDVHHLLQILIYTKISESKYDLFYTSTHIKEAFRRIHSCGHAILSLAHFFLCWQNRAHRLSLYAKMC